MKKLFSILLVTICLPLMAALDSTEQALVKAIDADLGNGKALLIESVNINSGTMNFEGVRQVGDLFSAELKAIGFETQWVDGKAFNRSGHLVASYGDEGVKLLLIGHLDTVFAKESSLQKAEAIANNKMKGPGITDMKGGDVIIIQAMKALKQAGELDKMQIRIIMTGDEESRGAPHRLANKALLAAADWADIALGFEDGDGNPKTAVVARRGSTGWTLKVKGKPAHSSQIFREDIGYGAILETSRIMTEFTKQLTKLNNLTFNPGLILGGTETEYQGKSRGTAFGKRNVIAQTTMVQGGIRAMSPEQLAEAQKMMHKIVANNYPHTSAELIFKDGYPPMAPRESNYKLLGLYSSASEDLGFGKVDPVDPRKAGAADISFTASYVTMALDGLGLMGDGGHTIDEVADMNTFESQTKRATILMYRLNQAHNKGTL